jgi:hypothetical protein
MGVGGQRQAPAALPLGRTLYPLYRRLSGPQGLSELVRKLSPPTGIRSPNGPARSKSLSRPTPKTKTELYIYIHKLNIYVQYFFKIV